jgi:hypothetical protein
MFSFQLVLGSRSTCWSPNRVYLRGVVSLRGSKSRLGKFSQVWYPRLDSSARSGHVGLQVVFCIGVGFGPSVVRLYKHMRCRKL